MFEDNPNLLPLNTLLSSYNQLYFFQRWFFPKTLAAALKQFEEAEDKNSFYTAAAKVYRVFGTNKSFFARFFSCLNAFRNDPLTGLFTPWICSHPGAKFQKLGQFKLLIQSLYPAEMFEFLKSFETFFKNFDLSKHVKAILEAANQKDLLEALYTVQKLGLLGGGYAQGNFERILHHPKQDLFLNILKDLQSDHLLEGSDGHRYFLRALCTKDLAKFSSVRIFLREIGLLTWKRFDAFLTCAEFEALSAILRLLQQLGLLTEERFDALLTCVELGVLSAILILLNEAKLLSGEKASDYLETLLQAAFKSYLLYSIARSRTPPLSRLEKWLLALNILKRANLLNNVQADYVQKMFHAVAPDDFAHGLNRLVEKNLLENEQIQSYFNDFAQSDDPKYIVDRLIKLQEIDVLDCEHAWYYVKTVMSLHWCHFENSLAGIKILREIGLLTNPKAKDNFDALIANDLVSHVLVRIEQRGLLQKENAQSYFDAIVTSKHRFALYKSLEIIDKAGMLRIDNDRNNFHVLNEIISKAQGPNQIPDILQSLFEKSILTDKHLQMMANSTVPKRLGLGFIKLSIDRDLLANNREVITQSSAPDNLASALGILYRSALLTEPNRQALIQFPKQESISVVLETIEENASLSDIEFQDYFDKLIKTTPSSLVYCLEDGAKAGLFQGNDAKKNVKTILYRYFKDDDRSHFITKALIRLHHAGLLTDLTRELLTVSKNPSDLAAVFIRLNKCNLLTKEIYETVQRWDSYSFRLSHALDILKQGKLLNQAVLKTLLKCCCLEKIPSALQELAEANLFTESNVIAVLQSLWPDALVSGLAVLSQENLLSYRETIIESKSPSFLAEILKTLHAVSPALLTGEKAEYHLKRIIKNAGLPVYALFDALYRSRLLSGPEAQERFDSVMTYIDTLTFTYTFQTNVRFNWVPPHMFTVSCFNRLIRLAENHRGQIARGNLAIRNYIQHLIDLRDHTEDNFNNAQSTHTASVHATTDLTLWLLYGKYGSTNLPETSWKEIGTRLEKVREKPKAEEVSSSAWIEVENTSAQIEAAKRCFERLSEAPVYLELNEEKKRVSFNLLNKLNLLENKTIQALFPALSITRIESEESSNWIYVKSANHKLALSIDPEKEKQMIPLKTFILWLYEEIKGQANDMEALVHALYEIQRGYNLNEEGKDDLGSKDLAICFGGTANKFCECLVSFSTLIQFIYVDKTTITARLKQETINAVVNHCHQLAEKKKTDELAPMIKAFEDIEDPDNKAGSYIRIIYLDNATAIANDVRQEFEDLYPQLALVNMIDKFIELLDLVKIPLAKLPKINKEACYASDHFFRLLDETIGESRLNGTSCSIK